MNRIKQILAGLALIVIGIISVIPENDATAAVFLMPIGIYAIFTKEKVFDFEVNHGTRKMLRK